MPHKQMNDQKGSFQANKIKNDRRIGRLGGSFRKGANARPTDSVPTVSNPRVK